MNRDLSKFVDLGLGYNPLSPDVVNFNPRWKRFFSDEAYLIFDSLRIENLKLFHIGSTSIEGLCAKPIIDIMGSVSDFSELDRKTAIMEQLGFEAKESLEFRTDDILFYVIKKLT